MRTDPKVEPVLNTDFATNTPDEQTVHDILNLADNLLKLYSVDDLPLITLQLTYPYIQSTIYAVSQSLELKISDDQGFIQRMFIYDKTKNLQTVRVISQQDSFDTRLILLLNEHLTKFQNSNYMVKSITPEIVKVANAIVMERLCRQK